MYDIEKITGAKGGWGETCAERRNVLHARARKLKRVARTSGNASDNETRRVQSKTNYTSHRGRREKRSSTHSRSPPPPPSSRTHPVGVLLLGFFSYPLVPRIHAVVHRRFDPLINIARTGTRGTTYPAASFFFHVTTAGSLPKQRTKSIVANLDPSAHPRDLRSRRCCDPTISPRRYNV